LESNQILKHAHRLSGIPGIIVHGRYDVVCPLQNAWELHRAWPGSQLEIVPDAGHSAAEPGITNVLIKAAIDMAVLLGPDQAS
jgi:proline iminopeptidase